MVGGGAAVAPIVAPRLAAAERAREPRDPGIYSGPQKHQ